MPDELIKYKLTFPVKKEIVNGETVLKKETQIRVKDDYLTFSIGQVRSRTPSVMYFKFYGFYHKGTSPIIEYTSPRWVISPEYTLKYDTFNIKEILDNVSSTILTELGVTSLSPTDLDHYYMELYTIGVDSENPLYMNHIMLAEGDNVDYHQPNDKKADVKIGFHQNYYINLYDNSDTYLQIIRPNREEMTSTTITPSKTTILVPHLPNESSWDNPMNVFYEFMYQTEQRIGIEK